ncbi:MAG: heme exporter protein CcmB [Armatimonadota bacterium]|nr:heme exporter protein CcmB [Armatimonadota bacterium]MDR5702835.1 heme exporter protein CcmB [Armatimonadota bacterium]
MGRAILTLLWKDLRVELRTKEILTTMMVLALLILVILNVAMGQNVATVKLAASGVLWVVFTFAATLGLSRVFLVEKERGQLSGILLAPMDRSAIFLGKMIGSTILVLLVEAVALPVFVVLFNFPLGGRVGPLLLPLFLGTVGFIAVETLFSAISAQTRLREILLPLLAFPVAMPALVGAVGATAKVLDGLPLHSAAPELQLLVAFDILFVAIGLVVFEYVVEEE